MVAKTSDLEAFEPATYGVGEESINQSDIRGLWMFIFQSVFLETDVLCVSELVKLRKIRKVKLKKVTEK